MTINVLPVRLRRVAEYNMVQLGDRPLALVGQHVSLLRDNRRGANEVLAGLRMKILTEFDGRYKLRVYVRTKPVPRTHTKDGPGNFGRGIESTTQEEISLNHRTDARRPLRSWAKNLPGSATPRTRFGLKQTFNDGPFKTKPGHDPWSFASPGNGFASNGEGITAISRTLTRGSRARWKTRPDEEVVIISQPSSPTYLKVCPLALYF